MVLTRTLEERRAIELADKVKKRESQERARARAAQRRQTQAALKESAAPNKRDPRQRDVGFLSWLHEDLPCIGCLVEGPGPVGYATIEAAHQKVAIAAKGWSKGGLGPRVHDLGRTCPLCVWHHTAAANACDKGQRQFWDRIGLGDDVADFCRALADAYLAGRPGRAVVTSFAAAAIADRTQSPEPRSA